MPGFYKTVPWHKDVLPMKVLQPLASTSLTLSNGMILSRLSSAARSGKCMHAVYGKTVCTKKRKPQICFLLEGLDPEQVTLK